MMFAAVVTGNPSWYDHVDLMNVLIGALFIVISWFLVRAIKQIDANQTELFKRMNNLSEEFYTLKGEHHARMNIKVKC